MKKTRKKQEYYRYRRQKEALKGTEKEPVGMNIRVILAMMIVLSILIMEKYDYVIAGVSVDTVYHVVYDNEDFERLEGAINESFKTIR